MKIVSWSLRAAALVALGAAILVHPPHRADATGALPAPFDATLVDTSKNACTDFFAYATSKWRNAHPIPAEYSEYGYIEALENETQTILKSVLEAAVPTQNDPSSPTQKIGALYASCMDTAAIEKRGMSPLHDELARIDGLTRANLPAEIAHLHVLGVDVGFSVGAAQDLKHSDQMIAEVDQSGLGLPERDFYFRADADSKAIRQKYVTHVARMLAFTGDTRAASDAQAVMTLETALAKDSVPEAQLRDPEAVYHIMDEQRIATLMPHFSFARYWSAAQLPDTPKINVAEPGFLGAVDVQSAKASLSTWKSYLRWHLVSAFAGQLPKRVSDESFDFYGKTLDGTPQQRPRWKRCQSQVDAYLGMDLGKAYVEKTFPAEARQRAMDMTLRIRSAYADEMANLEWMTPETKKVAEAKLAAMGLKVGYPQVWRSYDGYDVRAGDYFGDVLRGHEFNRTYDLVQIGKPIDKNRWGMTPQTVNAYNDTSRNEIVLPAAQLQPPFFAADASDAANLGATGGGTVGHEMTHGFDDQGHKFDMHGNLANWWTASDTKAFDARANCVINQFNNAFAVPGVHYNGKLVAGEAIADLGGVTIAYHALEESLKGKDKQNIDGFTPEQAYFIAYAQSWTESNRPEAARNQALTDPHPLPKDRVNLTVQNIPGWYEAFHCPMPPKICTVW